MLELEYITNEQTKERRLYYRYDVFCVDASGALCPTDQWSEWKRVPERTLDEASLRDVVESGGIADAP